MWELWQDTWLQLLFVRRPDKIARFSRSEVLSTFKTILEAHDSYHNLGGRKASYHVYPRGRSSEWPKPFRQVSII